MARKNKTLVLTEAYKMTFASEQGQRVLFDILNQCHMLVSHRTKDVIDPLTLAFKEGERNVALRILSIMQTDMGKLKELIDRKQREEENEAPII